MTRSLTRPSAMPIAEQPLAAVNRQFMRLVLRERGTALYIEDRRTLFTMVAGLFPWLPEDQRQDVFITLMQRYESGVLTGISNEYVRCIARDLRKKETRERNRRPQLEDEEAVASNAAGPAVGITIREVGERIRGSLKGDDVVLFDRWVESGNEQGWQRGVAHELGKSDGWVSTRLKRLREWMREEHDILDANMFVETLANYEAPEDEDEVPPAHVPEVQTQRDDNNGIVP